MSRKIIGVTVGTNLSPQKMREKIGIDEAGFATEEYVRNRIAEAELGGKDVDLSGYAQKSELPTKVSQLQNDTGYLTKVPDGYAKSEDIPTKPSDIGAQPAGDYALVSQIPSVPVKSVNGKTGAVSLSASDVGAMPSGTSIPSKTSELTNDSGFITGYTETDPTVPAWAKNSTKPSYSKSEVGLGNVDNVKQYSASNPPPYPVTSVNGKTGAVTLDASAVGARPSSWMPTAAQVGADPAGTAATAVSTHNQSEEAHPDIRQELSQLSEIKADNAAVFEYTNNPLFTNLLNTADIEYGKMINITDKTVEDTTANLATTGYIPVSAGGVLRVNEDFPLYTVGSTAYILYDANKNALQSYRLNSIVEDAYYVSLVESDENGHVIACQINKPASVAFIRICNNTTVIGENPVLTINEEIQYEMGYGEKLNQRVKVDHSQIVNAPGRHGWNILPYERLNIAYSSIGRKPINTVEHFTDAAENFGYNVLKCDVRPTSDGELVCCHDAGFTFNSSGKITTYDSANATVIRSVTAATVLGYSFPTGEHPCLVGDYLDICRKYGKVAFITIRNEYMDVVIPKLLEELRSHNMTYSSIINCMTYESLVQWRQQDTSVMINYTMNAGVAIDQTQIDRAVGLGYCSLCGFGLTSSATTPNHTCDFEYARANGIRLLQAIAYKEGSPEACYAMGYDGCQIGYAWNPKSSGSSVDSYSKAEIDAIMGSYITDISNLVGGDG